jgi:hypothetical protein
MQRGDRVDLHVHSTASDGVLSPSEVVFLALENGLSALALTDHDTTAGIAEAVDAAKGTGLEVIPGVEINSEGPWGDLHILGYYLDPLHPLLMERLRDIREARYRRARRMVEKLERLGLPVDWETIEDLAQGESIGRPHVARALLHHEHVQSIQEAFDHYISRSGPAYAPRLRLSRDEAIELIEAAGGVAVLAHPVQSDGVEQIPELVSLGLQGLEVYYPGHTAEDVDVLLDLCRRYRLVPTGGTDFHAPRHAEGALLGSVDVPPESVTELRSRTRPSV